MIYEPVMRAGADFMMAFQGVSPALEWTMRVLTFFGEESFYMIVITLIFWCFDQRFAVRLLGLLVLSSFLTDICKLALHSPRAYWWDASVQALVSESSYGPPSGHSSNGIALWGYAGYYLKRTTGRSWVLPLCIVIGLSIGISRMYLGVHFPHDVILGWLLGGSALLGMIFLGEGFLSWYTHLTGRARVVVAMLVVFFVIGVGVALKLVLADIADDPIWVENALADQPGERIDPRSLKNFANLAGVAFALAMGGSLYQKHARFLSQGSGLQLLGRYLLGIVGVFAIRAGLSYLFGSGDDPVALALRFVRYFLIVFWALYLAPLLFLRLKLARSPTPV